MSMTLENWVQGRWVRGEGVLSDLHNPTTEAVIARTGTRGLDFQGVLQHARKVGGPALRGMGFAERGAMLLAMSKVIHAQREALVELAISNGGNTRGDAKFDIDGAWGTLAWYAKLGTSLGDGRILQDGPQESLARNPRYVGQHIKTSRLGAAVHINAFNFPAWGFAEKAAVALLAGVPVVSKPATSTALVAQRCVRLLVDAGVLPEGALQLICGSTGDLLDHLEPQDHLAFTGSSATGTSLRGRERLLRLGVRVTVEADSLNAAVLGPDVEPGSDTWEMFVREVVKDLSQKAGQKCTAIRRILVPASRIDAATEDLRSRVEELVLGDPSLDGVDVGPLCTADQLRDVRAGVVRLLTVTRPIVGSGGRGTPKGAGDKGWFVEPTLLLAQDSSAAPIHGDEVFGPVQTVLPYSGSAEDAAGLVGLGQGSLVSSIYSDDEAWTRQAILAMAPWCGRLHVGSSKVADHSPGPGTVLPQMVHGGPGRAGAGEELGGLRGLDFYLQRTAVQGLKPWLERLG